MSETRDRILEVAEGLFADRGYAGVSLRHIIAEAGVNLAAVHYHFGSKEELLDALVLRGAEPVNAVRLANLARVEAEAGTGPLQVEKLIAAFLEPMAAVAVRHPQFVRLMGRMHAEGLMPAIAQKHFGPIFQRFLGAFRRAMPDLPEREFLWRVHFMIGAMSHTMCGSPSFAPPGAAEEGFECRLDRLAAFLSGGFRAPVSRAELAEEKK